jgi:glycerol-3-phosphate acyltransferase PlsY
VPLAAVGYAAATSVLVVASHADNIGRLRAGTERRLGEKEALSHGRRG